MNHRNVRSVANQQRNVVHVVNVNGIVDGKLWFFLGKFILFRLILARLVNVKLNIGQNINQSAK